MLDGFDLRRLEGYGDAGTALCVINKWLSVGAIVLVPVKLCDCAGVEAESKDALRCTAQDWIATCLRILGHYRCEAGR
jgi:hypothetical protein